MKIFDYCGDLFGFCKERGYHFKKKLIPQFMRDDYYTFIPSKEIERCLLMDSTLAKALCSNEFVALDSNDDLKTFKSPAHWLQNYLYNNIGISIKTSDLNDFLEIIKGHASTDAELAADLEKYYMIFNKVEKDKKIIELDEE